MQLGVVGMLLLQYKYIVAVPLVFVMQPLVLLTCGLLARFGLMHFWLAYLIIVAATLLGDAMWYFIGFQWGEKFAHRYGRFLSITPSHIELARQLFRKYHATILFLSKITNAFGLAIVVLFTAGLTRVPFWRYMVLNLIGESIWSLILMTAGYHFADLYVKINDVWGRVTLTAFLAALIIAAIGFIFFLRRELETRMH